MNHDLCQLKIYPITNIRLWLRMSIDMIGLIGSVTMMTNHTIPYMINISHSSNVWVATFKLRQIQTRT